MRPILIRQLRSSSEISDRVKICNFHRNVGMESGTENRSTDGSICENPMDIIKENQTSFRSFMEAHLGRTLRNTCHGKHKRAKANSTGNISRSHSRHHCAEMMNYSTEKMRSPRHVGTGNASHQNHQAGSHISCRLRISDDSGLQLPMNDNLFASLTSEVEK